MANFASFTTSGNQEIEINIDLISYIKPGGDKRTAIYFDKEHSINVSGSFKEIK